MSQVFVSTSADETKQVATDLAKTLSGGEVIALYGEMGAGKTVFAKGIALGLGIEKNISSPTFNIIKQYDGATLAFNHIDLYRLSEGEAQGLGITELYANAVTVIEWPEREPSLLPAKCIAVRITSRDNGQREITITKKGIKEG